MNSSYIGLAGRLTCRVWPVILTDLNWNIHLLHLWFLKYFESKSRCLRFWKSRMCYCIIHLTLFSPWLIYSKKRRKTQMCWRLSKRCIAVAQILKLCRYWQKPRAMVKKSLPWLSCAHVLMKNPILWLLTSYKRQARWWCMALWVIKPMPKWFWLCVVSKTSWCAMCIWVQATITRAMRVCTPTMDWWPHILIFVKMCIGCFRNSLVWADRQN